MEAPIKITSCEATRKFVRYAGNRTTFIEWAGAYHELHNDIIRDNVV
jgi:alpha-beta hydrolase superfamily lysophospholipase